jgi:hypothetical protein
MISLFKGDHLDWAKYAIYCDKYSMETKEMNVANMAWQQESSGVCKVRKALRPPNCSRGRNASQIVYANNPT